MKHLCLYVYPLEPTGPSMTYYSVYDLESVVNFLQKQPEDATFPNAIFNYYENFEKFSCLDVVKQMLNNDEHSTQRVTSKYIFSFVYVAEDVFQYLLKKKVFSGYTVTSLGTDMRFTVISTDLKGYYNGQEDIDDQPLQALNIVDELDTVLTCAIKKIVKTNIEAGVTEERVLNDGTNIYTIKTFQESGSKVIIDSRQYRHPEQLKRFGYKSSARLYYV